MICSIKEVIWDMNLVGFTLIGWFEKPSRDFRDFRYNKLLLIKLKLQRASNEGKHQNFHAGLQASQVYSERNQTSKIDLLEKKDHSKQLILDFGLGPKYVFKLHINLC